MNKSSYPKADTQKDIVLALSIEAQGKFIDALRLTSESKSLAVYSNISELREEHRWRILNLCEYILENSEKAFHSSYRIALGQAEQKIQQFT